MADLPEGPPVEIENLMAQVATARDQAGALLDGVRRKFISPEFIRIWGDQLFGSPTKVTIGTDGNEVEIDWTLDEILHAMGASQEEGERTTRHQLTTETMLIVESFDQTGGEQGGNAGMQFAQARDLVYDVLQRVIFSDEQLTDARPLHVAETRYLTEFLEVVRRTVLRSPYMLIEGVNETPITSIPSFDEGEHWEDVFKENFDHFASADERYERARKKVDRYTSDDWPTIIDTVAQYSLEYFQQRARRLTRRLPDEINFASRLTIRGRRAYSDDQVQVYTRRAQEVQDVARELGELKHFNELIPFIGSRFGKDATTSTLLDFLT